MPGERLTLALERLGTGDWELFERFAAEFLAVEYPSLRTMAAPSGDRGRDGQLHVPDEDPKVALQYSVAHDWQDKINATVRRLSETSPHVSQIIYATNQRIGPDADDLVARLRRDKRLGLDIRDRNWFVERELTAPQRQVASEELAERLVDPLLGARGIRENVGIALSEAEARVALLHLSLESRDEATGKGLTKASFEALTLAALHDTHSQQRLGLADITERVDSYLPARSVQQVNALVLGALGRLSARGGPVKRHASTSDYCLSNAEVISLKARTATFLAEEAELESVLLSAAKESGALGAVDEKYWPAIARDLRTGLEGLLLKRGEAFVAATENGNVVLLGVHEITENLGDLQRDPNNPQTNEQIAFVILRAVNAPNSLVEAHLRRLSDAYTMFAFLRQTPDVQRVVLRMFGEGELWLDTSLILPLIAETLVADPQDRHYTVIMRASVDAGLRLFVTNGVIEEVERHLNRCSTYARGVTGGWRGRVPFVYTAYAMSGGARTAIEAWLETFRGSARPEEDISEYLKEVFAIETRDLLEYSEGAAVELRGAVAEVWNEVHERRRTTEETEMDPAIVQRLVAHDVENTVGVIERRRQAVSSPFGYRAWWLTLDRTAFSLRGELISRLGSEAPASPVLSPDFLVQLLRMGPMRTAVNRELRIHLPLLTDISMYDFVPRDLVDEADKFREATSCTDERVLRRRVRDSLDERRAQVGPDALAGARSMERRVLDALRAQGA